MTVSELIDFLKVQDQDRNVVVFDHLRSDADTTRTITINCAMSVGRALILCNEGEQS